MDMTVEFCLWCESPEGQYKRFAYEWLKRFQARERTKLLPIFRGDL